MAWSSRRDPLSHLLVVLLLLPLHPHVLLSHAQECILIHLHAVSPAIIPCMMPMQRPYNKMLSLPGFRSSTSGPSIRAVCERQYSQNSSCLCRCTSKHLALISFHSLVLAVRWRERHLIKHKLRLQHATSPFKRVFCHCLEQRYAWTAAKAVEE